MTSRIVHFYISTYLSIISAFCFPVRISKTNHKTSVYDSHVVSRYKTDHRFVSFQVPRVGVMLVGWGGNNGTTVTAACLANKLGLSWHTKEGERSPDYFGSITQAATLLLGTGPGGEVHVPFNSLLPMIHPNDIVFDGE